MEKKKYQFRLTIEKELVDRLAGHHVTYEMFENISKGIAEHFKTDALFEEVKYWIENYEELMENKAARENG